MKILFQFFWFIFLGAFRFGVVATDHKKGGGGGTTTDDDPFEEKLLEGVGQLRTNQEKLLQDVDRLDKQTKGALEEFTKVKNNMTSLEEYKVKLDKLNLMLQREARNSFGSPVARISGDDQLRAAFNYAIRAAMNDKNGDLNAVLKTIRKGLPEDFSPYRAIEQKALSEGSSPGSTLINTALFKEIYDSLAEYGSWNTLGVRRMGTRLTKLPIKTARAVCNVILSEAGTISDDGNKTGSTVNLQAEVLAVLINVSRQLLADAEFDVTADVMDDFVEAFNYRLDYLSFVADGTADATNGGMTGLFNFATAVTAATTHTSVAALTLADFISVLTGVDSVVLQRKAAWWTHPQMLARIGGIKDLSGRPLFQTALEAPAPGKIGSIMGYPVNLVQVAPNTDGTSKQVAAFGDPNAYVVGIRQDFEMEASDEFRWNTYERSFRGIGRAGTKGRKATALAVLGTAAS